MYSVTAVVKKTKQPYGGYIPPKSFKVVQLDDGLQLGGLEELNPSLVGIAVDYLSRYLSGTPKEEAFKISLMGAALANPRISPSGSAWLAKIKGLDDDSIIAACHLVSYDVCVRAGMLAYRPLPVSFIHDGCTINNIRIMVNRVLTFLDMYGPVVRDGITFEGAYTDTVSAGDADFITSDTLWDLKVTKNAITSRHTLQLLMYYVMGLHSVHEDLHRLKRIGIFNPRLNKVFTFEASEIDAAVLQCVELDVIGYTD